VTSILLALFIVQGTQDVAPDKIAALLEKLGAEDVEEREKASRDLIALGTGALPALEKRFADMVDGEPKARLKAVLERLRRFVRIAEVAPKIRTVTATARDVPLRTLLADLSVQSGVAIECADAVADRPVTIEIKAESAIQAVDRICLARGDLTSTVADGKLKVAAGEPSRAPTAYTEGFRVRLRRKVVLEAGDFAKNRTDIVIHATFDAQPDQKCKGASVVPGAEGVSAAGSIAVRSAAEFQVGAWIGTGAKNYCTVDDVMVVLEDGDSLELAFVMKDAPAGLKSFDTLKIKSRFRYPVAVVPTTTPLTGRGRQTMIGDLPYFLHMGGRNLYLYAAPRPGQPAVPPLNDLIDLESLTVVDSAGKENKLTMQPVRGARSTQYQFMADRDLVEGEMSLKYNLYDAFDRDVEFELKDVKLRD